jgi:DNA repair exonuclease SbcCD ATPase subunit
LLLCHLAAGLVFIAPGCGRSPTGPAPDDTIKTEASETDANWPPERIASDPDGYLQYADRRISEQVAGRERRLSQLGARRAEIEKKSTDLIQRVADAKNIQERLAAAIQRAEDEDRWPMKFAGKTFSHDKASSVLAAVTAYQKDREPLAAAYGEALKKIAATERALRNDLAGLGQMREKLALDLERVRLNQGMAELADLRQTEAKLANFSAALAGLSEDPFGAPASTNVPDQDLDELLN